MTAPIRPTTAAALLLRVTAYDPTETAALAGPPFPGGELDIDTPFQVDLPGAQTVTYLAATIGRSTVPGDTPANTWVPGKYTGVLNFGSALFTGTDPIGPGSLVALGAGNPGELVLGRGGSTVVANSSSLAAGTSTVGGIDLIDPDGELDETTVLGWAGAKVEILRGDPSANFSAWTVIAVFYAAGIVWDARKKQIKLRDPGWLLAAAPLHDYRYAGTGGVEGDAPLANTLKPILYGERFNITPRQIGASLLIYQVSCTSVQAITAVRDGGAALTLDTTVGTAGDCASYAALAAATVASGKYATCLALGLFRLGGAPARQITCGARGDADTVGGVGYTNTRAGIARRIAIGRGVLKLTTDQLDAASFTAMDAAQTGACGWYFDQAISKAAALQRVLGGCLGYASFTPAGLLSVGYYDEPASTADFTVRIPGGSATSFDIDARGEPAMPLFGSPRQATYLGYAGNDTTQTQEQLAGSVSQADAAVYREPMKFVPSVGSQIARDLPSVNIVTIDSGFVNATDAQAECTRQQRIMGRQLHRYSLDVDADPCAQVLGRTAGLVGWSRYSMMGSKNFRVVGVGVGARNAVTYELLG